jgi:hypothetical protein
MTKPGFIRDEAGAVTVDWVVLTGAVVGLGGAVMVSTGAGTMSLANLVSTTVSDTIKDSVPTLDTYISANTVAGDVDATVAAVIAAIDADAPEGYRFIGQYDSETHYPFYVLWDAQTGWGNSGVVGGKVYTAENIGELTMIQFHAGYF